MHEAHKNTSISGKPPADPAMNYEHLRDLALETLTHLATDHWTDFNDHDPGITILDFLCYALTDIGYRASFPVPDILADESGIKRQPFANQFFTPGKILFSSPVTVNDYRKLLIDIEGVRHAWVIAGSAADDFRGLYSIVIDAEWDMEMQAGQNELPAETQKKLREAITEKLRNHRNLGEDFNLGDQIQILKPLRLELEGTFEINPLGNTETTLAGILFTVEVFLNTGARFRTLNELVEKRGMAVEDIFSGPRLDHGFILTKDLKPRIQSVDAEKLIPLIKQVKYLETILNLQFGIWGAKPEERERSRGPLELSGEVAPFVSFTKVTDFEKVKVMRSGKAVEYNREEVIKRLSLMRAQNHNMRHALREWDLPVLPGRNRNISRYFSIQNDFPANYGIGPYGLPRHASPARRAQAKQLKTFLLIFDQIMANYLSQLANLQNLFSWDPAITRTYFPKPVGKIPPLPAPVDEEKWLLGLRQGKFKDERDRNFLRELFTSLVQGETLDERERSYAERLDELSENRELALRRKDRVLRHLMARFAEEFKDYYQFVMSQSRQSGEEAAEGAYEVIVRNRIQFLKNYESISGFRGKGLNHFQEESFGQNFCGLKKRLALLLGFEVGLSEEMPASFNKRFELSEETPAENETVESGDETDWVIVQASDEADIEVSESLDLSELLVAARQLSHFKAVESGEGRWTLCLSRGDSHPLFLIRNVFADEAAAMKGARNLSELLRKWDKTAEDFHLMEHILLRPSDEEPVFGFMVNDPVHGGQSLSTGRLKTRKERDLLVSEFINSAPNEGSKGWYRSVKRLDGESYQLEIHWGREELSHRQPYATRIQAEQAFDRIRALAQRIAKGQASLAELVSPYADSQLPHIAETTLRDPWSGIVSVVLPDWPSRFALPGFRSVVENTLRGEAPAHLFLNIVWLGKMEMQQFEALRLKWLQEYREGKNGIHARELLGFLIRFSLRDHFHVKEDA